MSLSESQLSSRKIVFENQTLKMIQKKVVINKNPSQCCILFKIVCYLVTIAALLAFFSFCGIAIFTKNQEIQVLNNQNKELNNLNIVFKDELEKMKEESSIAKEEVKSLADKYQKAMNEMNSLEKEIRKQVEFKDQPGMIHSDFLNTFEKGFLYSLFPDYEVKFILVYKASYHGDAYHQFHKELDNVSNVLLLMETHRGDKIGGYVNHVCPVLSGKPETFKDIDDSEAFLFSINKEQKYPVIKHQEALLCMRQDLISFNQDLRIFPGCLDHYSNYSLFPTSYESKGSKRRGLAKDEFFLLNELEAYKVIFNPK